MMPFDGEWSNQSLDKMSFASFWNSISSSVYVVFLRQQHLHLCSGNFQVPFCSSIYLRNTCRVWTIGSGQLCPPLYNNKWGEVGHFLTSLLPRAWLTHVTVILCWGIWLLDLCIVTEVNLAAITLYSTALKRLKNECANTVRSLTEVGNSMIELFVCNMPWVRATQSEEL